MPGLHSLASEPIPTINPPLRGDIISLYGLKPMADALARTKPDGSKGVKLRKSYKSHIQDIPGRHTIPTPNTISNCTPEEIAKIDKHICHLAYVPLQSQHDFLNSHPPIEPFSSDFLTKSLNFEITGPNGVPGFDSQRLAMDDSASEALLAKTKKRKAEEDLANAQKKKALKL